MWIVNVHFNSVLLLGRLLERRRRLSGACNPRWPRDILDLHYPPLPPLQVNYETLTESEPCIKRLKDDIRADASVGAGAWMERLVNERTMSREW